MQRGRKKIKRAVAGETFKVLTAEEALPQRKIPKRVPTISTRFPYWPNWREDLVKNRRLRADQWRSTGVSHSQAIRMYQDLKSLIEGYKSIFKKSMEHPSPMLLLYRCVPLETRIIPVKRYKRVAAITCKRTLKGLIFYAKFKLDNHSSFRFYIGLDSFQLKDGSDKMILM